MSHISKTREEVLKLGTPNDDGETVTFNTLELKDALISLYGQAFTRGVTEFRENLDRVYEEKAREAV